MAPVHYWPPLPPLVHPVPQYEPTPIGPHPAPHARTDPRFLPQTVLGNLDEYTHPMGHGPPSPLGSIEPPNPRLPQKASLDYYKTALELLLLLLAVPWIVRELTKNPGKVTKQAAQHHLKAG